MTDTNTRVEHLLNSNVGCAFVALLDLNYLTPQDMENQKTILHIAADCADFLDRNRADHEIIVPGVRALANEKADQARAIIEHPATDWWFEPLDLNRQAWLSVNWEVDKFIYGTPPNTDKWTRPQNPSGPWERYAQKPIGNQSTSTLYGPRLTSELIAYDDRVGDFWCQFPLAWWAMRFPQDARVFEIHGPSDWHELCVRYPAIYEDDGRLVPNWGAVSEEWDGVHLSLGGLLTTEQARYESSAGWTMLEYWHAEQTYWLRSLDVESTRLPDYDRTTPEDYEDYKGFNFPRFPDEDDSAGLLMRT